MQTFTALRPALVLADAPKALACGRKFLELGGQDPEVEAVIDELEAGPSGPGESGEEE